MLRPLLLAICLIGWNKAAHSRQKETSVNWQGRDSLTNKQLILPVSFAKKTGFHSADYFHLLGSNLRYQATSPLRYRPSANSLLPLTLAAVSLLGEDRRLNSEFREAKAKYWLVHKGSPVITSFGGYHGLLMVGGLGILGAITRDEKLTTTVMLSSQAFITSGIWAFVFKTSFGRTRPYTYNHWTGPGRIFRPEDRSLPDCDEFNSFPSGHTTTAFAIATVFAKRYSEKPVIGITAYSLATLVGISRMTENRHWGSDVLAGGLLGYLCGSAVVKNYERNLLRTVASNRKQQNRLARLGIMPVHNSYATSLVINYSL